MTDVRRDLALLGGGAAAASLGALLLRRRVRREPGGAPADARAEDLRRKLAEARATAADEEDFQAAGMGAETVVTEEHPVARLTREEVDEARRRVHEEARAAAEEMRGERGERA